MISRFFFIILLIVQTNTSYGIAEFKIIATVNNIAITNLDLNKEISVIKLLNKSRLELVGHLLWKHQIK